MASSVLSSPLPSAPVFVAHDGREINTEFEYKRTISEGNAESQRSDRKIEMRLSEDMFLSSFPNSRLDLFTFFFFFTVQGNKPKAGPHITDNIGWLQVLK